MRLCTDMRERVQIDLCMRMCMDMRIWTDMYVKEKSEVEAKTQQLKSMTAAWKKVRRSHIRTHAFMHLWDTSLGEGGGDSCEREGRGRGGSTEEGTQSHIVHAHPTHSHAGGSGSCRCKDKG